MIKDFKRRLAGESFLTEAQPDPSAQYYDPRIDGVAYAPPTALPPAPAAAPVERSPPAPPTSMGGFKAAFRSGFAPVGLNAPAPAASEPAVEMDEDVDGELYVDGEPAEDVDGEGIDVDGEEVDGKPVGGEEPMEFESDTDADIFGA